MTEILTGAQLKERAESCLDQRRPDKATLRSWIRRGAERIDQLAAEVQRLRNELESGGSEAALMMLEDAREAADSTLARVNQMEAEAAAALEEARAKAGTETAELTEQARTEASQIVAAAREQAKAKLHRAAEKADQIDQGCRRLVDKAAVLDATYRERLAAIRAEMTELLSLMDGLEAMPVAGADDPIDHHEINEALADIEIDREDIQDLLGEVVELDNGDDSTDAGDSSTDAGDSSTDAGDDPTDAGDDPTDAGDDSTDAGDSSTDDEAQPEEEAAPTG